MTDQNIGRLAMRREGKWWNAYWAQPDTMGGAIHLGSIHIRFVEDDDEIKGRFLDLMRDAAKKLVEEAIGGTVTWPNPPQAAPESERSGHG